MKRFLIRIRLPFGRLDFALHKKQKKIAVWLKTWKHTNKTLAFIQSEIQLRIHSLFGSLTAVGLILIQITFLLHTLMWLLCSHLYKWATLRTNTHQGIWTVLDTCFSAHFLTLLQHFKIFLGTNLLPKAVTKHNCSLIEISPFSTLFLNLHVLRCRPCKCKSYGRPWLVSMIPGRPYTKAESSSQSL